MKPLLIALLSISALLYGCTATKVATISSEKTPQIANGFVFENDTVKITYQFWSNDGRMQFDLYNKLNVPIYIDWKTSAYIPNDKMVSYWQDVTNTQGVYSSSAYLFNRMETYGSSRSKSVHQERIAVIPPQSMITQKDYSLIKSRADITTIGNFDKNNTPLRFRNYLTIATNEKFEGQTSSINNSFFVSSVKNVSSGKYLKYKSPDAFYIGLKR